jgi:3-deoxy-D-manno-octulosonic acid (KDO) 8-phosphate synthase
MANTSFIGRVLVVGVAIAALAGCGGNQVLMPKEAPAWVIKGSGAFKDAGESVFYGVGAVVGMNNKPLAVTSAENRARAEVAKVFQTYSASLMKDYAASTTGGAAITADTPTSEEQHIEQTIKTFSAVTLSGVMIVDRWEDPNNATIYSLARLDLKAFEDQVKKMQELNANVKAYVKDNAERAFDDLATEEDRRR